MMVTKFEMRGFFECFLRDPNGKERYVGTFENLYTNNAKERTLRTLLNTAGGDKISVTDYPAKLAYCTGAFPSSPQSDPLGAVADDPNGYNAFGALANITSTSSSCYGTKTATWTNASGGALIVTYVACVYANAVAASNIYNIANITDTSVAVAQSFVINYTWQFNFDTASEI